MTDNRFTSAFDAIADVVGKAAALPDHRERPLPAIEVEETSNAGEVQVIVADGKVRSLRLDHLWVADTHPDYVADLVRDTVNTAHERWSRLELEQVMSVTPDMRDLSAAIQDARSQLDQAWFQTLADAKVPRP